ncbi:MAG: hypothetical protein D6715_12690 [Calditrichaeota bacterium]|nr:MAG: hypothetical protein D6715_12690 [Calditrichota bacterium]
MASNRILTWGLPIFFRFHSAIRPFPGRFLWLLVLGGLLASGPAWSQKPSLESARRKLQTIQRQIQKLQGELSQTESRLRNELQVVEKLERQIALGQQAIRLIEEQVRQKEKNIAVLNGQIDSLQQQIHQLRQIFSRQVVFAYKYQRGHMLDWLLGAKNLNQALLRYWYFRKISTSARSLYERIALKEKQLEAKRTALAREVDEQRQWLAEKNAEQRDLEKRRRERTALVAKIKKNKTLLSQALREKKRNYQELQRLIASLEARRETRQLEPATQTRWEKLSGNFARQKGRLNWPVKGKVLHPFGRYRNPELKTVLFNSGVDLRARKGSPVRCVFPGVVSMITYMSGFGNTVIVDHNNGYYTVYAHLDEVLVSPDQFVEAGQQLGTVGDSGSLEGAMLHFAVFGGNKPRDPLKWLKKQ